MRDSLRGWDLFREMFDETYNTEERIFMTLKQDLF